MANRRAHNSFSKVHAVGSRGSLAVSAQSRDKYVQAAKKRSDEYVPCPRCGRMMKDPSRTHMSDPPNKIGCFDFDELYGSK